MSNFLAYEERADCNASRERIFARLRTAQGTMPSWWFLSLSYGPIIVLLMLGVLSASWWIRSNAGERQTTDWRPILAQAVALGVNSASLKIFHRWFTMERSCREFTAELSQRLTHRRA